MSPAWLPRPLLLSYGGRFVLLWIMGRGALAVGSWMYQRPLFTFRPGAEATACALELFVLAFFLRRSADDLFLGNLGFGLARTLWPFAVLHFLLSLALSLV